MRVEQVALHLWRIPADAAPGMLVPGLVVADEPLVRQIRADAALAQLATAPRCRGSCGRRSRCRTSTRLRPLGVIKG